MEICDGNKIINADLEFTNWIVKLQKNALFEVIFGITFGCFIEYAIFINSRNSILSMFSSFVVFIAIAIYIYGRTYFRGKVLNCTVKQIVVTEHTLILITYPVKILGLFKWNSLTSNIDLSDRSFVELEYPFKEKDRIKLNAIGFRVGNAYFYVLREALNLNEIQYFDSVA